MKELVKKLNNFKLTALVEGIMAIIGLISIGLCLGFYQTSGLYVWDDNHQKTPGTTTAFFDNQALGMVFFLFAILAIILGLIVIVTAFKHAFPKDKLLPARYLGWVLVAENVCLIVVLALVLVILLGEGTHHPAGFGIALGVGAISIILAGLNVYPTLVCRYYTPELIKK